MVCPRQKDARGKHTKINYGLDTTGEKEKRTSMKNVDGRSTSSHDNKKFRTRSMEKQRNGVWFPEDGDSCKTTGQIDVYNTQITQDFRHTVGKFHCYFSMLSPRTSPK